MFFLVLIVLPLSIYLVVEEKERRAMNPEALGWLRRVQKSAVQHIWFLAALFIGLGIQIMRGKDLTESLASTAVGVGIFVFMTLHAATLSLPRADKTPDKPTPPAAREPRQP